MSSPELARSFGAVAREYDRARPGYPDAAIRWLLGETPLTVADLGAGTGKLTAALLAAGHRVVAVEPLQEMLELLVRRVPEASLRAGSAEETGLPDGSVDAVVAGAAFHWFDRSRAFAEIGRILRPPGILGLLGNGFDGSADWVIHLRELLGGARLGHPGHWPDPPELGLWFDRIEDREFAHEQTVDRALLVDLALSRSSVASLGEAERAPLLARIDALWDEEPELRGRDSALLPYLTRVRRASGLRGA
jgi:SAM-dependent methyltransferase